MDRWEPWVTEAEPVRKPGAFPVCRQAGGQFFDELESRNWRGIVRKTLSFCGFYTAKRRSWLCLNPRACLGAVFSFVFMFPLVILDGTPSTEAALQ